MSEPLSSSEIEDVLSSIRRLVSEDMRPAPARSGSVLGRVQAPAKALSAQQPNDTKLILTPALRVVQPHDSARNSVPPMFTAAPRADLSAVPRADAASHDHEADLGAMVANFGAGVDTQDDEWEAETGDIAPSVLDAVNLTDAMLGQADNFEFLLQRQMDRQVADLDAKVDALDTVHAAEADFAEMVEEGEHRFKAAVEPETAAPAWAQTDGYDDDDAEAADHDLDPPPVHAEPDAEWAAAAEASVIAALAAEDQGSFRHEPEPSVDAQDDFLDKDFRIDETMLRELVRDVLREELAGRIGERITRNIRKLVRAEIANALAAQELS